MLAMVAPWLGGNLKAFGTGWAEGYIRSRSKNFPDVIPGSTYDQGTVEFAASQAAVAFIIAMREE